MTVDKTIAADPQLDELREIFADGECTIPAIQRALRVGYQRASRLFNLLHPQTGGDVTIHNGDALEMLRTLPDESVQCCVTSPPYWGLRDYGCAGQIGLEPTIDEFISKLVEVFREVRRVLKSDGTAWVNMGDAYASSPGKHSPDDKIGSKQATNSGSVARGDKVSPGLKPKDLIGQPWMLAFALRADGWYLRSDIIWNKSNPMPESVSDRPTKSHEYLFLLTKSERYYYDFEAIKEPVTGNAHARGDGVNPKSKWKTPDGWDTSSGDGGHGTIHREGREKGKTPGKNSRIHSAKNVGGRPPQSRQNESFSAAVRCLVDTRNKRSVWTVPTHPYSDAHFATYPPDLIKPCILAGSRPGDTVLDPFGGSGTTGAVALELGRRACLIELNPDYIPLIERRTSVTKGLGL